LAKKIGIGWTNFAAVAMETKKGGFKKLLDSFHQTSCNFVGISTVVYDSPCGVETNQNGGHCHGNQGEINFPIKFHQFLFGE
jgi:hypothetical protein